jgi:hypothetical protein
MAGSMRYNKCQDQSGKNISVMYKRPPAQSSWKCGDRQVEGHSSHHVQSLEKPKRKRKTLQAEGRQKKKNPAKEKEENREGKLARSRINNRIELENERSKRRKHNRSRVFPTQYPKPSRPH